MSLVGFKAQNHPQQAVKDDVNDRRTPNDLFIPLQIEHMFTVDAAASDENAKRRRYFTIEDNGLERSWANERVWCNPPYSNIRPWVEKALIETANECPLVVLLLPANRCEQSWWQDLVEPIRDQSDGRCSVKFLRGRLRFDGVAPAKDGKGNRPPFGCCLVTLRKIS